jgi:hypothetical protein
MKEIKKIHIILIILILVFFIIAFKLLEPTQDENVNSLRPTFNIFNMIFWLIIGFLSSFPFIICILKYKIPMDGDGN